MRPRLTLPRTQRTDDAAPAVLATEPGHEPETPATFRTSTEVWLIAYREVEGPTLVRSPGGRRSRPNPRPILDRAVDGASDDERARRQR